MNFDTVSSLPWFENIPDEYREQITAGQWPGKYHHKKMNDWRTFINKKGIETVIN